MVATFSSVRLLRVPTLYLNIPSRSYMDRHLNVLQFQLALKAGHRFPRYRLQKVARSAQGRDK